MKKYLIAFTLLSFVVACGSNNDNENAGNNGATEENADAGAATEDVTQTAAYKEGLALIGKNDCLTCHTVNQKLVGPSYMDVSNKYAGSDTAVTYLAHKIIHGGSGVWGDIAMTPHPNLSQQDAEAMVKYILLLKDTQ